MYAVVDNSYQKFYLISDTLPTGNQVAVYHQNVLIGYFKIAGHPEPNVDIDFDKALLFASTSTSLGTKYIFTFTPEDIDMDTYFDEYLYHFVMSVSGETTEPLFGTVVDRKTQCCLAKLVSSVIKECDGCQDAQGLKEINTVHAYLTGAKAAIRMKSVETALCALKVIDSICSTCGDCG